ncbi:hypothetical protein EUX98_g2370 [Antrodiella citrinella]|uniref:Uncharacterized protein n=1 Tax=Antrodiella citrinella TaxID=2447956 RepID=A0A4S4N264_9APHY|nr:hypothetical protein EUX98_g2370 [Antrodiella citrinella]
MVRRHKFSIFQSDALELRALPNALLIKPQNPWPDPPFHWDTERKFEKRLNMSLCIQQSVKVHPSGLARRAIGKRIKSVLGLIVTRGADVEVVEGVPTIKFNHDDVGEKWLLKGWTYFVRPQPCLHLMGHAEVIPILRAALLDIKLKGDAMEEAWARGNTLPPETRRTERKLSRERSNVSNYNSSKPSSGQSKSGKQRSARQPSTSSSWTLS